MNKRFCGIAGPCLQLILIYVFHLIYFEMLLLRVLSVRARILTDVGGVLR